MVSLKFKYFPVIWFLLGIISACTTTKKTAHREVRDLQRLMAGKYSSLAQSQRDTDYYHISLHMVPIWTNHADAWLYVEQAMGTKQDKPYRQRVYRLSKSGDRFVSEVYTLKNEKEAVGKAATPKWFEQFKPDAILELRDGCAVVLKKLNATTFEGQTEGTGCASNLRGASYATSIVRIDKDKIVSWDQGFDAQGKQVWGATKGGYIFEKE